MTKERVLAFSDGFFSIIITIMVLELRPPEGNSFGALIPMWPKFLSYVLSFIYLGIYWNNHHHLFVAVHKVNGSILWKNLLLLFWLSLVPFTTSWMGENHFSAPAVALYGVSLLMPAIFFTILLMSLIKLHGKDSLLARAIGNDFKGKISVVCYVVGIGLSFFNPWLSLILYAVVAAIWLIPDNRIEKRIKD